MGAIIAGIAFFSLAGYIVRLAFRGSAGRDPLAERQRPVRHRAQKPPKVA